VISWILRGKRLRMEKGDADEMAKISNNGIHTDNS
jgi:hypothetical protein